MSGPETPNPTPALAVGETPPVIEVRDLDWAAIARDVNPPAIRERIRASVVAMEALLGRPEGPGLLFDADRAGPSDRAIRVSAPENTPDNASEKASENASDHFSDTTGPLWIIGDLHGDLLALEASLALIHRHAQDERTGAPRILFLGDFVDDEGFGLEVLLRVFELIVAAPQLVAVLAGNHDEALAHDGKRFTSSVSPSDFSEFLDANAADEWIVRAGKVAIRLTAHVPRALFFPDGLLVAHGGFPLADLHPALIATGDWNDPKCLSDFVWARAHPTARKKMPNRFSHGSQFGYEDFADFCALSAQLGRPVTHFVRGHDHVEERYAIYPAYHAHPVLTTVALSRRLPREQFGPYERAPTLARVVTGSLPQVYQLHPPRELVNAVYPNPSPPGAPAVEQAGDAAGNGAGDAGPGNAR